MVKLWRRGAPAPHLRTVNFAPRSGGSGRGRNFPGRVCLGPRNPGRVSLTERRPMPRNGGNFSLIRYRKVVRLRTCRAEFPRGKPSFIGMRIKHHSSCCANGFAALRAWRAPRPATRPRHTPRRTARLRARNCAPMRRSRTKAPLRRKVPTTGQRAEALGDKLEGPTALLCPPAGVDPEIALRHHRTGKHPGDSGRPTARRRSDVRPKITTLCNHLGGKTAGSRDMPVTGF